MKFISEDGKWRFESDRNYSLAKKGEYALSPTQAGFRRVNEDEEVAAYLLHRIPQEHTAGGVVFEETGEVRHAKYDEWFLDNNTILIWTFPGTETIAQHPILRPVRVEEKP